MPASAAARDFGPTTQQFNAAINREALPSGTRIGGYQIVEVLGGGGFGIVYLALDPSLQRQVAIKEYLPTSIACRGPGQQVVMRPGGNADTYATGLSTFLHEAKLLSRFDHPALVRVLSFWEQNRSAYMVMPYYPGRTLAAELKASTRPPDEAWLRRLLTPLLSALQQLHGAGCYHRDISPDNILLRPDGSPLLLDLGAATYAERDKTLPLTALLNPAYAPIEQYSDTAELAQGPWTDLYALASVVYLAIVGKAPVGATVRAVEDRQPPLAKTVQELQAAFPGLRYSASFLAAIDKALSVNPRNRQRTVADFQASLDRVSAAPTAAPRGQPAADDEAINAAIAAALRALPARTRQEPSMRPPEFQPSVMMDENARPPMAPPAPRSRALPMLLGLCALALLAGGAWQVMKLQRGKAAAPAVAAALPQTSSSTRAMAAPAAPAVDTSASATPDGDAPTPEPASTASPSPSISAEPTAPPVAAAPERAAKDAQPPAQQEVTLPGKAAARAEKDIEKEIGKGKAEAEVPEPNNPRAVCGTRTNFALLYCMQAQCKRPKFAQHAQCLDLKERGEVR